MFVFRNRWQVYTGFSNYVNELYDGMMKGHSKEVLEDVLEKMINYSKTHLKYEKDLVKEHCYPKYEEHKNREKETL
jgi:hemerythrin